MPWVLDSQFPYQDPASANAQNAQWDSDSTSGTVTDTPHCSVATNVLHRSREDHFAMFILFCPEGDGAIWVPLRVVRWGWCGRVNRAQDKHLTLMGPIWKWRPVELREQELDAQYLLEVEETTQLPTWTSVTTAYDDQWDEQQVINDQI